MHSGNNFIESESLELVIPPTTLTFITTYTYSAACKNCCLNCNPKRRERLKISKMKRYLRQAVELYPTLKILVLSGGECFLLGEDLDKIVKYASQKGLFVRVVTNGFWAKTFKKAYLRLNKLVQLGLSEVNLSTGNEHQEWVSYDSIVNAAVASLKLNNYEI